jgi:hypothetical protein
MWATPDGLEPLHYVVVSKGCVVEVLAENADVFQLAVVHA